MASRAWVVLAALLCASALLAWPVDRHLIDWQPALAWAQPWRAFSAVAVHYGAQHLLANLTGALLLAMLGVVAHVPARGALAWGVAWPLTQFGLLIQPALLHYGGLSGVLHAGVAVVAIHLLVRGSTSQRRIGGAIMIGLCVKVLSESPWGAPLRHPEGWDIAVTPLAHASGLLAGVICAGVSEAWYGHRASANARHG